MSTVPPLRNSSRKKGFCRRTMLVAAPVLLFNARYSQARGMKSELRELKAQYLEEGTSRYNFPAVMQKRKVKMGACIPYQFYPISADYRSLIMENFSVFVPEVALNWDNDIRFGYRTISEKTPILEMLAIAKKTNAAVKGHALYYSKVFPPAIQSALYSTSSDREVETKILDMVSERMEFYRGKISHWVINEIFDRKGNYYPDPMIERLGPQIILKICRAAVRANPSISLEVCDNKIGFARNNRSLKPTIKLIRQLQAAQINISHIGVQAHFDMTEDPDLSLRPYKVMQREGLTFSINEIDVNDRNFRGTEEEREYLIAHKYYSYLSAVTKMPNLTEVTSWSPFDANNWVKRGGVEGSRTLDPKSSTGWFDEQLRPKFLYFVTAKALLG